MLFPRGGYRHRTLEVGEAGLGALLLAFLNAAFKFPERIEILIHRNAIGRANIETVGLRAEIAPSSRWDAFAAYRPMWLAEKTDSFSTTGVRDVTGVSGSFAGHQLEGRVRYWLVPSFLRAEINAVWLAKGRFLHAAPNAPATGDTTYLATSVAASF